jgi:hypothetical protein
MHSIFASTIIVAQLGLEIGFDAGAKPTCTDPETGTFDYGTGTHAEAKRTSSKPEGADQ